MLTLHGPNNIITKNILEGLEKAGIDVSYELNEKELCLNSPSETFIIDLTMNKRLGHIIDDAKKMLHTDRLTPKKIYLEKGVFKPDISEFIIDNKKVTLTEKECALMLILWENFPEPASKDTLLKRVWEYHTELETHTLETHIYRLRQKIETDASNPELLITKQDGYKLMISEKADQ